MKRIISFAICMIFLLSTLGAYAEELPEVQPEEPQIEEEISIEEIINPKLKSYGAKFAVLSWNAMADYEYDVYRYGKNGYIRIGSVISDTDGKLTYRVSGLAAAKAYRFKVVNEELGSRAVLRMSTAPLRVTGVKLKRMTGKCDRVSYNRRSKADGYTIRYSTSRSFKTYRQISTAKTARKIYKLKRGKRYYYKIRAWKKYNGKKYYGQFSKVKSFVHHDKEVKKGVTYFDGILMVNKSYSLPESYGKGLKKKAKSAFNDMAEAAEKKGVNLWIASGYRSYTYQKNLYSRYRAISGAYADIYSARPGHSEHQSGYAMDVNQVSDGFANTREGRWLAKNCHKYGFIIRYPSGKYEMTGYKYEPWHIRYVGKPLAKKLYNGGKWITLEEYFEIESRY